MAAAEAKAGISLRRAHAADAFLRAEALDLIEIVADHYLQPHPRRNRGLAALRERFTIVPHGLDLSLGSAEGLNVPYLRALATLVDVVRPPYWSEHVAFTRAGGRAIGHLAPIPYTDEALEVVARNVARAQSAVAVPLALENIACPFDVPFATMTEGAFFKRLVERTGCSMLLDVANLYYNALNRGTDPFRLLDEYPLDAVVQCHLAGGHRSQATWIDSHAQPVPEGVWQLFENVAARAPLKAAIVERDENLPAFSELAAEAARARSIMRRCAA
ncbi:MAG: DUF692 domain-containing protein [Candidatus Eremiobacteraeota bacterium]|nr:DUF692 domain-containing protein [Candidatus Eremiobacteraeota bacterium]MBV8721643.1 DUF692 domain-containing protein [Candidatus Eremiobacteraeota bacterium]